MRRYCGAIAAFSGAVAPGTLNSASLTVNFATRNADFAVNLTVNSTTYSVANNAPTAIATDGTFTTSTAPRTSADSLRVRGPPMPV